MDEIERRYLTLALNLDRHFEGFIDAYFGPPDLRTEVTTGEPRPLTLLAEDAQQLQVAIAASDYGPQRADFLTRQTRAMAAVIHSLAGTPLEYVSEVQLYFDITPQMVDEAVFEAAHSEINRLLPGDGALVERMAAWKQHLEIRADRILPVFELALRETRRRTLARFALPPGEDLSLQLVENQPWAAYNWYLGDYQSRVELNTDLPLRADSAVPLLAHEAYAGHHTEHALKEHLLNRQQGRAEHAVQLLLAPECVLAEGIANSAQKILFDDAELIAFLRDELYPLAGLPDIDVEMQIQLRAALKDLSGVASNGALLLHRDGRPATEVQQYLEHYGLETPKEAVQTIKFLQNPLFRSYIFNYASGEALLSPLLQGADAVDVFYRLLTEPFTPSQVRQWIAEREAG